jgi:hypothetical protein
VILTRDGQQEDIGDLPPGATPSEDDGFTRLPERWEEVQQQIENMNQPR